MAEYDGSIKLSVNLTPGNVKQAAKELQGEIRRIFEASGNATNKGMQRLLAQMDKAYVKAQELQDQMDSLADQQIPTEQYQEIAKQIEDAERQLASLEARQEEMRDLGTTSGAAWDKIVNKINQAKNTIKYAKGEIQDLVDTGKAFTLGSDTEQYQTLVQKLGTVNNQIRVLFEARNDYIRRQEEAAEQAERRRAEAAEKAAQRQAAAEQRRAEAAERAAQRQAAVEQRRAEAAEAAERRRAEAAERAAQRQAAAEQRRAEAAERAAQRQAEAERRRAEAAEAAAQRQAEAERAEQEAAEEAEKAARMDRLKKSLYGVASVAQKVAKKITNLAESIIKLAATKTVAGISKLKNNILGLGKSASSSNLSMSKLLKTILMYGVGIRSLYVLFNKLKSAISTGFERISEFQGSASELGTAISGLKNNLTYLQNAWAAAFAPIATYVIPLINQMITAVANFANYLGAAFSILTGKQVMVKAIQNMNGYGEAASEAAEEQKKFNAELYSFDELNRQSSKDTGTGSGSDTADGIQNMFVEVPVSGNLPAALEDWLKRLKDLWSNEKYFDVGTHLADLLNNGVKKLDDWINGTFRPWATRWAGNIADVLNGVVAGLDWKDLGNTFADGVAAVLDTASTFLERFKFDELGRGISQALQGIFDNKDMWEQLARFFANAFNAMIDLAWGFLTESLPHMFDWGATIGNTLMDTLNNINWQRLAEVIVMGFESITQFLEGFLSDKAKWDTFAEKFTSAFSYVVENVDMARLGQDVNELLERIITLLADLDWKGLGIKVGEFLGQIDWLDILLKLGDMIFRFFSGVFEGLFNSDHGTAFLLLVGLLKGLPLAFSLATPGLKTAAGNLLTKGISAVFTRGAAILSPAFTAVTSAVATFGKDVAAQLASAAPAIAQTALLVFDGLMIAYDVKALYNAGKTYNETQKAINKETETTLSGYAKLYNEKGKEVADEYAKMVAGIDTSSMTFEEAQAALADKISHEYDGVAKNMWEGFTMGWNDYFGEGGKGLAGLIGDAFTGAVDGIKNLLGIHSPSTVFEDIGKNTVEGLLNGLRNTWDSITGFFDSALNTLTSAISAAWDGIKSGAETAWNAIRDGVTGAFNTAKDNVIAAATNLKDGAVNAWNAMKDALSTATDAIKTNVTDKFNNVKTAVTTTVENIKTGLGTKWDALKTSLSTKTDAIKSTISAKFDSLKATLTNKNWASIGTNIANGIKTGISNAWSSVTSTIGNLCNSAVSAAKSALKISSPSKVFTQIGEFAGLGLAEGIKGTETAVEQSVSSLLDGVSDADVELKNPIDYDSIIPGLDSAIERLSRLAGLFETISQSFTNISDIPIPPVARGETIPYQIVTGGRASGSGEADEEEGSLLAAVRDLVDAIRSNSNSDAEKVIQLNINGREVFNAVVDENNSALARTGRSPLRA